MELAFYLFKWFAFGCAVLLVAAVCWEIGKDIIGRCLNEVSESSSQSCDHDYETFETAERWRIRKDLERVPGGEPGRPSCRAEFIASIPRMGESTLEKRICLKCGNIDDEITPYIMQAIEERNRVEARKHKLQEMLAKFGRGVEDEDSNRAPLQNS